MVSYFFFCRPQKGRGAASTTSRREEHAVRVCAQYKNDGISDSRFEWIMQQNARRRQHAAYFFCKTYQQQQATGERSSRNKQGNNGGRMNNDYLLLLLN